MVTWRTTLLLTAAMIAAGCTGGQTPPPPRAAVVIEGFDYLPAAITVSAGATVTWTNRDTFGHTVTSGAPEAPSDEFDGTMGTTNDGKGKQFSVVLTRPGTYAYHCTFHPSMRGTVTVSPSESA